MNINEPFQWSVYLFDGQRTYIPATPLDLKQIMMESLAPAVDLYFDGVYQGSWVQKELTNEH